MFLAVITAPIVLAELIDILIRRSYVNPPMFEYSSCKFDPPRLIQDMNTSAPIYWRCDGLVLLAKIPSASPIRRDNAYLLYNAVATGNRNIEFYRETARSNCKKPWIATMPGRT
jgi:hypothetical protein